MYGIRVYRRDLQNSRIGLSSFWIYYCNYNKRLSFSLKSLLSSKGSTWGDTVIETRDESQWRNKFTELLLDVNALWSRKASYFTVTEESSWKFTDTGAMLTITMAKFIQHCCILLSRIKTTIVLLFRVWSSLTYKIHEFMKGNSYLSTVYIIVSFSSKTSNFHISSLILVRDRDYCAASFLSFHVIRYQRKCKRRSLPLQT